jgi:hypothetical protein
MPRAERAPEMSTLGCPCGYRTPPPWTDYQVAEHAWYHLMWEEMRRGFRKQRATYEQARDMVRAAGEFIDVLERTASTERGRIADLNDRLDEIAVAGRRVCDRWNDDDVDAGAMNRDIGQLRRAIDG